MRLSTQLTLLMVAVGTVPVAVSGVTGAWLVGQQQDESAQAQLAAHARGLADHADARVRQVLADVRLTVSAVDWSHLTPEEHQGALNLLYRQGPELAVAALVDAAGEGVGNPVFTPPGPLSDERARARVRVDDAALANFAQHIPLQAALRAGAAMGAPYPSAGGMRLAMAVAVDLGTDGRGVVAVEMDLQPLEARVQQVAQDARGAAALTVERGTVALAHNTLTTTLPTSVPTVANGSAAVEEVLLQDTPVWLARAPLAGLPWTALVFQPVQVAREPAVRLLQQALLWVAVALLCAVLAGVVLARGVARPLRRLTQAAGAFSRGDFRERPTPTGAQETRELTVAFNTMATEVQKRDEALRAFNAELQQRVDERTRDLKDAQDQIIQAQKMAAVGELGAGVAHEINNPLAGVLGSVQLLLLRNPDDATRARLQDVEREALRIRDIVQQLLALTPQKGTAETVVDLNRVVEAALGLMARPIVEARIQVRKELDPSLPRVRGRTADVQQAILALLSNARQAMPDGGVLTVRTAGVDAKLVRVTVQDTGHGVPEDIRERIFEPFFTTRSGQQQKGLGLALAHRVVTDMGGRLWLESPPTGGAAFHLSLAATRDRAHLL